MRFASVEPFAVTTSPSRSTRAVEIAPMLSPPPVAVAWVSVWALSARRSMPG
jgi:hypothetical protein